MAGGVFTVDGQYWAASSSTFYWVVETLAVRANAPHLAAQLSEISEERLGSLVISDFVDAEREELLSLIRSLPDVARRELPSYEGREGLIRHVESLVAMVAAEPD